MEFKDILCKILDEKGMTQLDLSNGTNITPATISRYITGKRKPSSENAKIIANFLGVSTDYLLGNEASNGLTEKDEKDIAKTMQKLKEQLANDKGLMFDGDVLDEETAKLLLDAIEQQEKLVKTINKKYTPNKYKK